MEQLYRITLSALLLCSALISCSDSEKGDPEPTPGNSNQLSGAWLLSSQVVEYYDASKTKVHEYHDSPDKTFTFKGDSIIITDKYMYPDRRVYHLLEVGGKRYVVMAPKGASGREYELSSVDKTTMTWESQHPNIVYHKGSITLEAASAHQKLVFTKK